MWNDILPLSLNVCNFHFTDVDECQLETDNCAQVCTNTPGSYMCGCDPGYELDGDGFSCNGKGFTFPLRFKYNSLIARYR